MALTQATLSRGTARNEQGQSTRFFFSVKKYYMPVIIQIRRELEMSVGESVSWSVFLIFAAQALRDAIKRGDKLEPRLDLE